MTLKRRKGFRAIATLLLFSISQIGLQIGLAEPRSSESESVRVVQQIVARLVTRNNQPITLNGQSASTGASLLSGATIETGADQSATVNVGPLGSVDISPNTKLVLTFEQGILKADVAFGCVILTARQNTTGEITTDKGSAGKTDPAAGGTLEMCYQQGAAGPTVGSGVAVNAGAGASTGATAGAAAGTSGGLFGLGTAATIAIIAAGTAAGLTPLWFPDDNTNPSPSAP
jgi:hypothetical protein